VCERLRVVDARDPDLRSADERGDLIEQVLAPAGCCCTAPVSAPSWRRSV
jgi:hypothetical protein